jgi:hypothetical protein
MVERRMRAAIICISSFWYTAWVNGGQPNLDFTQQNIQDSSEVEVFPGILPDKMMGRQEH